jgi:hypothetical protein
MKNAKIPASSLKSGIKGIGSTNLNSSVSGNKNSKIQDKKADSPKKSKIKKVD